MTSKKLDQLISQTEYSLAVTPIYDVGPAQPMLGEAITGRKGNFPNHKDAMEHCDRDHDDVPVLCCVDVVPAPKDLQFSDVTQTSFRATWEHGAPDVALYRIGWSKKGENNYQYVSIIHLCRYSLMISTETAFGTSEWSAEAEGTWETQAVEPVAPMFVAATVFTFSHAVFCFPHQEILNNDETTYVMENLEIDTPYDVSVTAIYPDEAESEDLLGTERTCKEATAAGRCSLDNLLN